MRDDGGEWGMTRVILDRGEEDDKRGAMARVCGTAGDAAGGRKPRGVLPPGPQRAGNTRSSG